MMKRDEERLRKIYEMRNKFDMHKKERELRLQIEHEETEKLKSKDYLHEKFEKEFQEKFVNPEKEEKSILLSEIKNSHKRIPLKDILGHSKKY